MGILADHVPSIEPLRPGVVEVIEATGETPKKWFGALYCAIYAHNLIACSIWRIRDRTPR